MAFVTFASTDAGAPTLSGTNGALVSVLDWVFTTKSADWDKVYSGTSKAVYRAKTGNRMYLRVVHDSTVSGSAANATVRAAESASDVDTLTDPFPTVALKSNSVCTWQVSDTANGTARAYRGIVTEHWIWLMITTGSNNAYAPYFFGQVPAKESSDSTYNTVLFITSGAGATTFFNMPSRFPGGSIDIFWARDFTGATKSTYGGHWPLSSQTGFGQLPSGSAVKAYAASPTGKMHLAPIRLTCNGAQSTTPGSNSLLERGYLPNVWQPLHQSSLITSLDTFVDNAYNGSASFELFSGSTSSGSAGAFLVLEKTNTWSAP